MVIKARLSEALTRSGKKQADLARASGVSTAGVSLWLKDDGKKSATLKHDNLMAIAKELGVSPDWLTGKSSVMNPVFNMGLVTDVIDGTVSQIPQYHADVAAGDGNLVAEEPASPDDYVTFKTSWLNRKGYFIDQLCVVYVSGDSMEKRVQHGDVVLVCRDRKELIDGRVYALNYSGMARLKRVIRMASGNIALISDNDPDGIRREEITPDTFEQLSLIGEAVWVGGDLR